MFFKLKKNNKIKGRWAKALFFWWFGLMIVWVGTAFRCIVFIILFTDFCWTFFLWSFSHVSIQWPFLFFLAKWTCIFFRFAHLTTALKFFYVKQQNQNKNIFLLFFSLSKNCQINWNTWDLLYLILNHCFFLLVIEMMKKSFNYYKILSSTWNSLFFPL